MLSRRSFSTLPLYVFSPDATGFWFPVEKQTALRAAAATMYSGTLGWLSSSFLKVAQDSSTCRCLRELFDYLLDFLLDKQILADRDQNGPAGEPPTRPAASAVDTSSRRFSCLRSLRREPGLFSYANRFHREIDGALASGRVRVPAHLCEGLCGGVGLSTRPVVD